MEVVLFLARLHHGSVLPSLPHFVFSHRPLLLASPLPTSLLEKSECASSHRYMQLNRCFTETQLRKHKVTSTNIFPSTLFRTSHDVRGNGENSRKQSIYKDNLNISTSNIANCATYTLAYLLASQLEYIFLKFWIYLDKYIQSIKLINIINSLNIIMLIINLRFDKVKWVGLHKSRNCSFMLMQRLSTLSIRS